MGKRKLEVKKIEDNISRASAFIRRKMGVVKKAMELSVLCEVGPPLARTQEHPGQYLSYRGQREAWRRWNGFHVYQERHTQKKWAWLTGQHPLQCDVVLVVFGKPTKDAKKGVLTQYSSGDIDLLLTKFVEQTPNQVFTNKDYQEIFNSKVPHPKSIFRRAMTGQEGLESISFLAYFFSNPTLQSIDRSHPCVRVLQNEKEKDAEASQSPKQARPGAASEGKTATEQELKDAAKSLKEHRQLPPPSTAAKPIQTSNARAVATLSTGRVADSSGRLAGQGRMLQQHPKPPTMPVNDRTKKVRQQQQQQQQQFGSQLHEPYQSPPLRPMEPAAPDQSYAEGEGEQGDAAIALEDNSHNFLEDESRIYPPPNYLTPGSPAIRSYSFYDLQNHPPKELQGHDEDQARDEEVDRWGELDWELLSGSPAIRSYSLYDLQNPLLHRQQFHQMSVVQRREGTEAGIADERTGEGGDGGLQCILEQAEHSGDRAEAENETHDLGSML